MQILANRLLLNIKQIGNDNDCPNTTLSTPAFAVNSFLGNIGAPLRVDTEGEYGPDFPEDYDMDIIEGSDEDVDPDKIVSMPAKDRPHEVMEIV